MIVMGLDQYRAQVTAEWPLHARHHAGQRSQPKSLTFTIVR